ncbi:MAG: hypothetical protein PHS93_08535 [Candidatus Omnitrophica bacterium]|nr:hypothetical protein [Candidatus Omnitrophota bacterium]
MKILLSIARAYIEFPTYEKVIAHVNNCCCRYDPGTVSDIVGAAWAFIEKELGIEIDTEDTIPAEIQI